MTPRADVADAEAGGADAAAVGTVVELTAPDDAAPAGRAVDAGASGARLSSP